MKEDITKNNNFSPSQVRAARGLLGWTQAELAERSRLSRPVIVRLEAEKSRVYPSNLDAIQSALEDAGIEFLQEDVQGEGVRFKEPRGKK